MTQAKKLKKQIRSRARKTGESYTAARRQVLRQRSSSARRSATPSTPAADVPASLRKKEVRLVEKTGHGWAHWFAVLDAFGAAQKGHTAAARHVASDHGVDGWHAQEITVEYERARGLRATHQRLSGHYEVSVSKVMPAPVGEVVAALRDRKRREAWAKSMDRELREALEAALVGPKGLRQRDRGDALMRFRTSAGVAILLSLDPRPKGRSSLVATNMKLKAKDDVERYRAAWRPALEALSRHLGG
jgi:hypothetical protein